MEQRIIYDIEAFFTNNKSYVTRIKFLKDNYPEILKKVNQGKIIENLYKFLYKITSDPVCLTCGNSVKFDTFQTGYRNFCSHKCSVTNNRTTARRKKTNLEKYGVEHSLSDERVRKKRKDTMIFKYGTEHPLQNDELKEKVNIKNKKRSQEDWANIHKKRKSSFLKTYGVENLWNDPNFVEKINTTNLKKYGVKWVQQNNDVLGKRIKSQRTSFLEILEKRFDNILPAFTVDDYVGINVFQGGSSYLWKCKVCEFIFEKIVKHDVEIKCPNCFPEEEYFNSRGEKELANFLNELNIDYETHNRVIAKPYEIDFLIHSHQLAIEYCGLYWHSDKKVDKKYHIRKKELCNKHNISLITIFEDEWLEKNEICKARLLFFLNKAKKLCGARQTNIKEISVKEYRTFINSNHLQGYTPAKIKIGAYYNNELVAVMSFGRQRVALGAKSSDNTYEMIRYASKFNIPGIASKLFSYFVNHYSPIKIISYCDLRWGNGNLYKILNFELDKQTLPNYWYTQDGLHRFHRYRFRKQELIKKGFDSLLTEKEIMASLGYYRIYDCGNYKFVWKNDQSSG